MDLLFETSVFLLFVEALLMGFAFFAESPPISDPLSGRLGLSFFLKSLKVEGFFLFETKISESKNKIFIINSLLFAWGRMSDSLG